MNFLSLSVYTYEATRILFKVGGQKDLVLRDHVRYELVGFQIKIKEMGNKGQTTCWFHIWEEK